ncbi:GRB2-associated-binding protein 3 [Talpa occidentalis]|uniref:GRB2-associated-binding protein 3 n=1 Tax=Talpa occidentalis TaxID=50954 RepID=UPI0023F6D56E|nr:GRB2-associated-binding protein 3 [Talpa occidentalis]
MRAARSLGERARAMFSGFLKACQRSLRARRPGCVLRSEAGAHLGAPPDISAVRGRTTVTPQGWQGVVHSFECCFCPGGSRGVCALTVDVVAWRRRWFVLRRGRMRGDPDVLEYYRSQRASKPIRAIDLRECAVWRHAGPGFVRKEFQNHFVFIVKTAARTFYLVAKTEDEMQRWLRSISQVCNLGHLEAGAADAVESLSRAALPPSRASSLRTGQAVGPSSPREDTSASAVATEDSRSESEFLFLPDYLVLSNCETGRPHHASLPSRCDSWSNSDRSLEQASFDDVFVDGPPPSATALAQPSRHASGAREAPAPRPQAARLWSGGPVRDCLSCSQSLDPSFNSPIQGEQNQGPLRYGVRDLDLTSATPPPRPPKPSHLSERRPEEQLLRTAGPSAFRQPGGAVVPRRISLSGLDNMRAWRADVGDQPLRHREKRLSLNLPCRFSPMCPTSSSGAEDSYVPMQAAASSRGRPCSPDEYIPMNSGSLSSPLPALPADLEPPPVNRDLKPQRKSRPPPLDLRSLSTIREHAALSRARTVPGNRSSLLSPDRNGFGSARFFASPAPREEEGSYMRMEEHRAASSLMWTRTCGLDYLALDFNSASPAPAQQKLLSEEHRVDYVQVDEQKTQALQSTRQEWTDERQSKADLDERAPPGQP